VSSRGPKPKTASNRRPSVASVPTPDHLEGLARVEFRRVVGLLKSHDRLEQSDPRLIEMYATTYALLREAQERLAGEPLVYDGPNYRTPSPYLTIIEKAESRLRGYINDLGLSPKSAKQAGVAGVSEGESTSKWSDLIAHAN
jgi:P27 family predicted phage terminase small subunit